MNLAVQCRSICHTKPMSNE